MNLWPALIVVGTFAPTALAAHVFLSTRRVYARWAKVVSVFAALAGLGWGIFGYAVSHHWYATNYGYFLLLAFKHNCADLVLGFLISIGLAHPSKKLYMSHLADDMRAKT